MPNAVGAATTAAAAPHTGYAVPKPLPRASRATPCASAPGAPGGRLHGFRQDAHNALLPPDASHLPVGRPVTHKTYRDAAHPSRLLLPFTKRGAADEEQPARDARTAKPEGGCQCPVAR
ncbi:hypothetical protein [Streptomyces sp. YIM B13518]|uniref:hypothetical protein n=1 Tax=Streptomyces sp. YIM B13518 TaxID=3366316 RepID=UPI00368A1FEF